MEITEIILGHGHQNISATHRTTLAATKNNQLSKRGDCFIAVSADKAVKDFSDKFKQMLRRDTARITILIEADEIADKVRALGSPQLTLTHPADLVVRKSSYTCSRTLAIQADKAACDLSRKLIERLRDPNQEVKMTLTLKI
jgi:hypothetical protein